MEKNLLADNCENTSFNFYPIFRRITRNLNAGLLLSLFFHWTTNGEATEEGWLCKSLSDMQNHLAMGKNPINNAKMKLIQLGLIEKKYAGGPPPRLIFRINSEKIAISITNFIENNKFASEQTSSKTL